jgi:multiple sugar transport system permease protein
MLIVTWEFTGYNMTILLTSLTNVPHQVLEAAKVDGCSELSIATRIKLPLIRRTIAFIVILSVIGTLQLFSEPVILNEIAAIGNSFTPNQIIYNTAFSFGNEQLASSWPPSPSWPPLRSSASCGASWTPWPSPGGGEQR